MSTYLGSREAQVYIAYVCLFPLTCIYWKAMPMMKLQVQLQQPARAIAAGRGPWLNSSATMNHGMGPGPISKKLTKRKIADMLT